jgi:chromosome partitioning protein
VGTHTTLVINPKGGSGKTTVAINLASYFASQGVSTAIVDYDPQGSSLNWLNLRSASQHPIHAANAAPQKTGLRTMRMHIPPETQQLVIDAPAGATGFVLQEMLSRAHCILLPVAPSAIDIHATANFIRDLLLTGRIRARNIKLGVVANKVRNSMPTYAPLERFLKSLNFPIIGRLSDSDAYLEAAETGVGIFEMEPSRFSAERAQFLPIVEWVGGPLKKGDEKVVALRANDKMPAALQASIPGILRKVWQPRPPAS